jgi:cation diffusion facilitator family transporter
MSVTASGLSIEETTALTRRVTRLSVATALVLSVVKLAAWWMSGSVAMLASLADSGLDLIAALAAFFAVRYAAEPPDREHRYGHGKAEAFASLVQAGLVFASAALIGREAIGHALHPQPLSHQGWNMAVMALSIALTGALILAQTKVLSQASSVAVAGDRVHYVADLASNLIAFAAIGASALLASALPDAVGALFVAGLLLWGAVNVFRASTVELMDRELDDASRRRIAELAGADPRIRDVHQLRTRAAGPYIHVQMHAELDPATSLVEAHRVMVEAEERVLREFPNADIIIHPDPRGQAAPHGGAFAESHEGATPEHQTARAARSR